MKTAIFVLACLACAFYYVQGACDKDTSKNTPYSCGSHSEPHFYEENGECHYTCLHKGEKMTCPHAHPVKLIETYIRSPCRQQVFDCTGHGDEHLEEHNDFCSYGCRSGDMILTCEQVYPYV